MKCLTDYWPRFQYHLEPQSGWMNDPNGLVYFNGKYHAFYQHYPYAPRWGQMHWGHAVSEDLIHWEHLPIALYPDREYENDGGCFSGSAVVKDGRLYLFYTSVSHEMGQTQSVAWSDDGVHFVKHEGNPMIRENPLHTRDFRDPKVSLIDGVYYMVLGSGDEDGGKVLLYRSDDLLGWEYLGVLFTDAGSRPAIECPDFFKLGDKYVLMYSKMNMPDGAAQFVVGDFLDGKLVNGRLCCPEGGVDFYAPQTFDAAGRRVMMGWMYHWGKEAPEGCSFAGALSIPRELTLVDGKVYNFPVEEARQLLKKESEFVRVEGNVLKVLDRRGNVWSRELPRIETVDILEDEKAVEVFVNGGEWSFSFWVE